MTELQKKELEILKVFLNVCEKLKLNYYLVCGSALGAAKYSGFIPWDDDIDVGMLKEDYEIFLKEAPKLLPDNLFLQNYNNTKGYPLLFSKIRNSDTTYIEKEYKNNKNMNMGIFIDVFPIYGYPKDEKLQKKIEVKKKYSWLKASCDLYMPKNWHKARLKAAFYRLLGYHKKTDRVVRSLDEFLSQWSTGDSDVWCNHGNWQGELEYAPKWHYGNGTMAKFEGLDVRIPENYDAYLTQKYGDWRADLPEEKKYGHHFYTVCDLDKPYTEYIKK